MSCFSTVAQVTLAIPVGFIISKEVEMEKERVTEEQVPLIGDELPEAEETEWQDVFTDQYKFIKEGDSIQGILTAKETSSFGVGAYQIQVDEEMTLSILGTTVLDRLFRQIPIGNEVQVTYTGSAPTKVGRNVKQFAVRYRPVKKAGGVLSNPSS